MTPWLAASWACALQGLPEDWLDPALLAPLDTRLDRQRVLAIALDPPVLPSGDRVRVQALLAWPGAAQAAVCGLRGDVKVEVTDLACFDQRDWVTELGPLPLDFAAPDLSRLAEPDPPVLELDPEAPAAWWEVEATRPFDGSRVPLLVEAGDAAGALVLPLLTRQRAPEEPLPPSLAAAGVQLQAGERTPRGEVTLLARFGAPLDRHGARWYASEGHFARTGRTLGLADGEGEVHQNRLQLPSDAGRVRVLVVGGSAADEANPVLVGDLAWAELWLD